MNDAKKQKKTTDWGRLEISSRKLEISREHFMCIHGKNTQKNYTKKDLMTQITMIVWSLT